MSDNQAHSGLGSSLKVFPVTVTLLGPLRPDRDLDRRRQRVVKGHSAGQDHFTEITLREARDPRNGEMIVDYFVKAKTLKSAQRVGVVYLSQLCDLLSAVTRAPVVFYEDEMECREQRNRQRQGGMHVGQILTLEQWNWVTGALVRIRQEHPRYLAAASWYRKGLTGTDCLDGFCCYWRVIERIATSYADKSHWSKDDAGVKKSVVQLASDLFDDESMPALLHDADRVRKVIKLRNDISHGNEPITPDMIEAAHQERDPLEEAAFAILERLRETKLTCEI